MAKKDPTARIAIAVHGGAGPDSDFIHQHEAEYKNGLKEALKRGYEILEKGGNAVDAVEAAVKSLEDNPFFNAGKGSALNNQAAVSMDASIMDGCNMRSGGVAMITNVKNPVVLARAVMDDTNHVLVGDKGALEFALDQELEVEADSYFITEHQYEVYKEKESRETIHDMLKKRIHGTVGAVALDKKGNLAAATSSGGTENGLNGRIGDSCLTGIGCYANNRTCAVSTTGDGEFLITGVVAHTISCFVELKNMPLQKAVDHVIHERNAHVEGDMGVISLNTKGEFGISFNSERMHRAWMSDTQPMKIGIWKEEKKDKL